MDPRSQAYFDAIIKKNPEELNEDEIFFLRARRSYLKRSQEEEYESILTINQTSEKTETVKQDARTDK
jgi:hypothetical protein